MTQLGRIDLAGYISAKNGLEGLVRAFARELGPHGVTVNCVRAGSIEVPAEHDVVPDHEAMTARQLDRQCIRRRGRPADVAAAVSYLVSPHSPAGPRHLGDRGGPCRRRPDTRRRGAPRVRDHAGRRTQRHADRHAELATITAELTKTRNATERYLCVFENGTLDEDLVAERLTALKATTRQLTARRDELAADLQHAPTAPEFVLRPAETLDDMLSTCVTRRGRSAWSEA